jgi:chloramphenicol 3-O phosphotransferase
MTIIFLNGAGSSGKSSIAKAIQHLSDVPYMTLGIDSFITMMPWDYVGFGPKSHEGFQFVAREEDGLPAISCNVGEFGQKVDSSMPEIVKVLADKGINLIIDEVLFGHEKLKSYMHALEKYKVYFIGVKCNLEAMEEREFLRGDRAIGLSRDQINKVHAGFRPYDLEVDTTNNSSFAYAKQILDFINKTPNPKGFKL